MKIKNQPRQFGKSTLVESLFIANVKAGKSVIYHHPDYVCMDRKTYQKLLSQKAEIQEHIEE